MWLNFVGAGNALAQAAPIGVRISPAPETPPATIQVFGVGGVAVVVEVADRIVNANWVAVATNTIGAGGSVEFVDSTSPNFFNRLYRARVVGSSAVSTNVVGYSVRQVGPGYSMIANPFLAATNIVSALLPTMPSGTIVFKPGTNGWSANEYRDRWSNTNMTLLPGEAAMFYNPQCCGLLLTFAGEVPAGDAQVLLPVGFSLVSSILGDQGLVATDLGIPLQNGLQVLKQAQTDDGTFLFESFVYFFGTWASFEPTISPGEAFWIKRFSVGSWFRPASVSGVAGSGYQVPLEPFSPVDGQIHFSTFNADAALGRVTQNGLPVETNFVGQLFQHLGGGDYQAIGSPVPFRSGFISGGVIATPYYFAVLADGTTLFQLRGWDATKASSYNEASYKQASPFSSRPFSMRLQNSGSGLSFPPPTANGFGSVEVSDDPQTPESPHYHIEGPAALQSGGNLFLIAKDNPYLTDAYQWFRNDVMLTGETKATLALTNAQPEHSGRYRVEVSRQLLGVPYPLTGSAVKEVTVFTPPQITLQPQSQMASVGQPVQLRASASGYPTPQIQWRLNGANLVGQTGETLTIPKASLTHGGKYSAIAINVGGAAASAVATVTVNDPAALAMTDAFAARVLAANATGFATAANTGATVETGEPRHAGKLGGKSLWLGWRAPADGVVTFSTRGSDFDTLMAAYAGSTLTNLTNVVSDDDGGGGLTSQFAFRVTNGVTYSIAVDGFAGSTGKVALGWGFVPGIPASPRIILQPLDQVVQAGATVTLAVGAVSDDIMGYQWFRDCAPLTGSTNATLILTNVSEGGVYRVQVRNQSKGGRVAESRSASMEVGVDPLKSTYDKFEDLLAASGVGMQAQSIRPASAGGVPLGSSESQLFSNFGATTQLGEPVHADVAGGASRWFLITPAQNGVLVIDTIGSEIDTVLAVYVGSSLNGLTSVAADDNGAPDGVRSLVRFNAFGGTNYLVAVDGVRAAQGRIKLNYLLGQVPAILATPVSWTTNLGSTVALSVVATGTPMPTYQWTLNGVPISGATNSTLTVTNGSGAQSGQYSVVVSNYAGVSLCTALVRFLRPLQLKSASMTADSFGSGTFRVALEGTDLPMVVLEASTNLNQWAPVLTNIGQTNVFFLMESNLFPATQRFYRVLERP